MPAVPPAEVTVDVLDEAGFARLLEAQRGNVVLIDYWATWCESCKELFPHTVGLHRQHAGDGLTVVSISLDDPEAEAAVLQVLRRFEATMPNYVSFYGGSDRSLEVFGIDDGTLPHFQLYDRQGKLHQVFRSSSGPIDPQQIDRAVEPLLAE